MATLNKIFDAVNKAVGWLLILLFSVMTVAYFGQIVMRYLFSSGLHWTEEITRYSQVALIMFGAAVLAGRNGHINVSVLETVVPRRMRKWVIIGQQVVTGAFFAIAVKLGVDFVINAGSQVSTNMRIPMAWVYMMFPIAYTILGFNVIVFILNTLTTTETLDEDPDEIMVDLTEGTTETIPGGDPLTTSDIGHSLEAEHHHHGPEAVPGGQAVPDHIDRPDQPKENL